MDYLQQINWKWSVYISCIFSVDKFVWWPGWHVRCEHVSILVRGTALLLLVQMLFVILHRLMLPSDWFSPRPSFSLIGWLVFLVILMLCMTPRDNNSRCWQNTPHLLRSNPQIFLLMREMLDKNWLVGGARCCALESCPSSSSSQVFIQIYLTSQICVQSK